MKTVILYGDQKNLGLFQQELEEYSILYLSDQDELIHTLMKRCPAVVLVIMEKAAGMEGGNSNTKNLSGYSGCVVLK